MEVITVYWVYTSYSKVMEKKMQATVRCGVLYWDNGKWKL